MLIINADDFGRSKSHTDTAVECLKAGRLTSATIMVFMEDSSRACQIAKELDFDVGLHLNFDTPFTGTTGVDVNIGEQHNRILRYFKLGKYSSIMYNFKLGNAFRTVVRSQIEEFRNLFGRDPSHIDGHHHLHLSANVVWGTLLPKGMPIRRNFSFSIGEKGGFNRLYRRCIDWKIMRRHKVVDYFYSLSAILNKNRIAEMNSLSCTKNVEIMTHPIHENEYRFLMGDEFYKLVNGVRRGTYRDLMIEGK
jgi:chitin disaccharide deacetylase